MTSPEELKRYVRDVADYPQKGIIFRDITPLLAEKKIFAEVVEMMSRPWTADPPDLVAAIAARGFIRGAAIALKLGAGVVGVQVLIELGYLEGRQRLQDVKLVSEIVY